MRIKFKYGIGDKVMIKSSPEDRACIVCDKLAFCHESILKLIGQVFVINRMKVYFNPDRSADITYLLSTMKGDAQFWLDAKHFKKMPKYPGR